MGKPGRPPGGKKFGGRQKGTPNKSFRAKEVAERLGVDPLEILIRFAAGDWKGLGYDSEVYHYEKGDGDGKSIGLGFVITPQIRSKCAAEACKYLYPTKIDYTDNTPEDNKNVDEIIERFKQIIG